MLVCYQVPVAAEDGGANDAGLAASCK